METMMKIFDLTELFPDYRLTDFIVPPVPRYVETKGYIYLLEDKVFPDHIKIGRTTDLNKRLLSYNDGKPFPTSVIVAITKLFSDAILVEKQILDYLYKNTAPTTFKKEWFEKHHKDLCLELMVEAEKNF